MSIATVSIGIALIVLASSCFKDIPFIGTVFLIPGDNIMNAKMANPLLRHALFLIGGAFTALGIFLQVKTGFGNALNKTSQRMDEGKSVDSTGIHLNEIREAKELLDSGAISEEEFSRIKEKLIKP